MCYCHIVLGGLLRVVLHALLYEQTMLCVIAIVAFIHLISFVSLS